MAEDESNIPTSSISEAEFQELLDLPACLEVDQLAELEGIASGGAVGFNRRATLGVLTRSVKELEESAASSPDIYAEIVQRVAAFKDHAQALVECAETAELRLAIVGTRGDLQASKAA